MKRGTGYLLEKLFGFCKRWDNALTLDREVKREYWFALVGERLHDFYEWTNKSR